MAIDPIGPKAPHVPPAPSARAPDPVEPSRPFEVSGLGPPPLSAPPAPAVERAGGALEQLRAGELDLQGYVDQKVTEATAHLAALPAAELEGIRSALRERLATDPTLVDLVRTATGKVAPEPSTEQ